MSAGRVQRGAVPYDDRFWLAKRVVVVVVVVVCCRGDHQACKHVESCTLLTSYFQ